MLPDPTFRAPLLPVLQNLQWAFIAPSFAIFAALAVELVANANANANAAVASDETPHFASRHHRSRRQLRGPLRTSSIMTW